MGLSAQGRESQGGPRLGALTKETLAGALLGAGGGLAFGLLFGTLRWLTAGAAQAVPASALAGAWAAAAAGGLAAFANFWFGAEALEWGELLAGWREARALPPAVAPPAFRAAEEDLAFQSNGEVRGEPVSPRR